MKITLTSALALLLPAAVYAGMTLEEMELQESWSYVPNDNYAACADADPTSWGCCGKADPDIPTMERCGPNNWIHINETTTTTCVNTDGNQQSPINFQSFGPSAMKMVKIPKEEGAMTFSGHKCEGDVEFKEGTWELVIPKDCEFKMTINGETYKMLQFHFHNAEHTVNYAYMPLEVHMVHANVDDEDDILVLGTFLGPGPASPFFNDLESAGNADPNDEEVLAKTTVNAYDMLPKNLSYWHYKGGLTTPPCQKKKGRYVKWYVFQNPNTLSYNQLYFFTSYFKDLPLANHGRVSRDVQKVLDSTVIQSYP